MARNFNGASDSISAGVSAYPSTAYTVSLWAYAFSLSNTYSCLFQLNDSPGSAGQQIFWKSTGLMAWYSGQNGVNQFIDPGSHTLLVNTWYNFVMVSDGTNLSTFITNTSDGTLTGTGGLIAYTHSNPLYIGNDQFTGSRNFVGTLADVAWWNTNLSTTDVAKLAAGYRPVDVNSANLKGWWPLGGSGAKEPDDSGNNNPGTITGTTIVGPPPAIQRGSRRFVRASSQNITFSSLPTITTNLSVSFWFNLASLPTGTGSPNRFFIIGKNNGTGTQYNYTVYLDNNGGTNCVNLTWTTATSTFVTIQNIGVDHPTFVVGRWVHVVITTDFTFGSNTAIYYNGASNTVQHAGSAGAPQTPTTIEAIGSDISTEYFDGNIADVAIWNVILSSSDATNLFNGRRPNSVQGGSLQGWWPLDGFSNSSETDASGNSITGTVNGPVPNLGPPPVWRMSHGA